MQLSAAASRSSTYDDDDFVGLPFKRLLDTVTVKCGHCSNLSFLSTRPALQGQCLSDHPTSLTLQQAGCCSDFRKGQSSSSSSPISSEPSSPKAPFVVKPPEKKHRLPSAYNRFMKEEIQRIKAANPEIPHREAFSAAAKNWARYIPSPSAGSDSGSCSSTNNIDALKGSDFAGMNVLAMCCQNPKTT
ncbi:protein CRABS CLAW isoform X4 [Prunus dulcis]|uniref:protein CRABS CLAW isoform X4 n=1 Tax=Prunus dulcis TaxID=3755 RepID=UPI0014835FB6|nr:protein CRABS CLAW isoform X4 [Prunus dulcis]